MLAGAPELAQELPGYGEDVVLVVHASLQCLLRRACVPELLTAFHADAAAFEPLCAKAPRGMRTHRRQGVADLLGPCEVVDKRAFARHALGLRAQGVVLHGGGVDAACPCGKRCAHAAQLRQRCRVGLCQGPERAYAESLERGGGLGTHAW